MIRENKRRRGGGFFPLSHTGRGTHPLAAHYLPGGTVPPVRAGVSMMSGRGERRPLMARWFSESRRLLRRSTLRRDDSPQPGNFGAPHNLTDCIPRCLASELSLFIYARGTARSRSDPPLPRLFVPRRPVIIQKRDISLSQFLLMTELSVLSFSLSLPRLSIYPGRRPRSAYRDNNRAAGPTGFREESCNKLYPRVDTWIGL